MISSSVPSWMDRWKNGLIDRIDRVFEVQRINGRRNFGGNPFQFIGFLSSITEIGNFEHLDRSRFDHKIFQIEKDRPLMARNSEHCSQRK